MSNKITQINSLLIHSKKEFEKFKNTFPRDDIYLLQASEKVWVAYNLLLEKIYGQELLGRDIRPYTNAWAKTHKKDKQLIPLYKTVHRLHIYHYQGDLSFNEVEKKLKMAWKLIPIIKSRYIRG